MSPPKRVRRTARYILDLLDCCSIPRLFFCWLYFDLARCSMIRVVLRVTAQKTGPFAIVATTLAALALFALMPSLKRTHIADVDENGLINRNTFSHRLPEGLYATGAFLPKHDGRGECFTEHRIRGTFAPSSEVFYIVVNSEFIASLDAANRLASIWRKHKTHMSFNAVFLLAKSSACLSEISKKLDYAVRIKGAVVLNHSSWHRSGLCVDYVSDYGTQPNHDFVFVTMQQSAAKPLDFCRGSRGDGSSSLSYFGWLDDILLLFAEHVTTLFGQADLYNKQAVAAYFEHVRHLILGFTRRTAKRSPLTAFHLGAAGYPAAIILRDASDIINVEQRSKSYDNNDSCDIVDKLVWSMNNVNERLHHSFAVWYPIRADAIIESNAAQLQVLVSAIGILVSAYFFWVSLSSPLEYPALLATNIATVVGLAIGTVVIHVTFDMPLSPASWHGAGCSAAAALDYFSRRAFLPNMSTACPISLLAIGTLLLALSPLSPATANVLGVAVTLGCLRVPSKSLIPRVLVNMLLRTLGLCACYFLLIIFFHDNESPAVAVISVLTGFAALAPG